MGADNIVKPILSARSGHLPLLVLFVGVIGGLATWGFTAMFIGATTPPSRLPCARARSRCTWRSRHQSGRPREYEPRT
jgi:hypothetical protein